MCGREGVEDVGGLEDVLTKVYGTLQIVHYHRSCIKTVVRACVCREDQADDGVSCYLGLHLGGRSDDRARALCELHVVCGMRVLVDISPCCVSDARECATSVDHGLSGYVLRVM